MDSVEEPDLTVVAHIGETVATDQPTYAAGTPITVSWTNMPGNPYDWVAIRAQGAPDDNASIVRWSYTGGVRAGSVTFPKGAPGGTYVAKAYAGGTYVPLATAPFTVDLPPPTPIPTVATNKTTYAALETITVSWTNLPGNPYDYVSLVPAGSAPGTTTPRWAYTNAVSGSRMFTGLQGGNYEARVHAGGTTTVLASYSFVVIAVAPSVATQKTNYATSEPITVSWTTGPTNPYTYVAVVAAGAPNTDPFLLRWTYTNGEVAGTRTLSGLAAAGDYEARLYSATKVLLAISPFTIGGATATCSPGTQPVFSGLLSGEIVLAPNQQYSTAPLDVALTSSILLTSVRENEPSPNYGSVLCWLHAAETMTVSGQPVSLPAGVTCLRNSMGTDTGSGQIAIRYSVASFASGVSVQRGIANTGLTNPTTVALSSIDASRSFVVLGGIANNGTGWGNNEFVRAQLTGSSLQLRTAAAGTRVPWQVVTMDGASVQRGSTTIASNAATGTVTLPVTAPSGSLALASYTTDNMSGTAASVMMLETRLRTPTSLSFERQSTGTTLDVSWEVISLPFATYSGLTTLAGGQSTVTVSVSGATFSPSTTVALTSTQSLFGPSTGSSSYNGSELDLVGEAAFTLATGSSSVVITRASTQAAARVPWTVVDFGQNCAGL
ncbi:MAG: hypothetical protein SFX73_25200 [Kofleriaceae bacterium]|nr:hypothetical protein [Kofleriaceae bacterium]